MPDIEIALVAVAFDDLSVNWPVYCPGCKPVMTP
ncbi:hypothetical protein MCEGEM3_01984 [Oxalobacteraceae bacterium]